MKIKNFIGNKMIGRFSALSVASTVHVTSYYNGKKYSYIMYKNGTSINIDRISVIEGDFKNGVEILVTLNEELSYSTLNEALCQLVYFKKLHVELKGHIPTSISNMVELFNRRKFIEYNNFCDCDFMYDSYFIRIGNVLYKTYDKDSSLSNKTITPIFRVGELDVTPNREQIQFTPKTKDNLSIRTQECLAEFDEILKKELKDIGYPTLHFILNNRRTIKLFVDFNISYNILDFPDSLEIKVKDTILTGSVIKRLYKTRGLCLDKNKYYSATRNSTDTKNYSVLSFIEKPIFLQKDARLKDVTKKYYDSFAINKNGYIIAKSEHLKTLYKTAITFLSKPEILDIWKILYTGEISNDNVPAVYIEKYKNDKKQTKITVNNANQYIRSRVYNEFGYRVHEENLSNFINYYSKYTTIYSVNTKEDDDFKSLAHICDIINSRLKVITVSKDTLPYLKDNKHFIDFDEYLSVKRKPLVKWATKVNTMEKTKDIAMPWNIQRRVISLCGGCSAKTQLEKAIYTKYLNNRWIDYSFVNMTIPTEDEIKFTQMQEDLYRSSNDLVSIFMAKKFGLKSVKSLSYLFMSVSKINKIISKYESS